MSTPDLTEPLDDDELDLLHESLLARAEDDSLVLDGVHGLISSVAIGPEAVAPSEWMPLVLDPGKPFASTDEAERLVTMLLRLSNMVVHDLERLAFEPILSQVETESGDVAYSARGWCEGFGMGMDLRAQLWERALEDDPRFRDLLQPVLALAADEGVFGDDEDGEDPVPLSEAEYEAALNGLPNAVLGVQQYWRDQDEAREAGIVPPARASESEGSEPGKPPRRRAGRSLH
jgi:uncharacterized protein